MPGALRDILLSFCPSGLRRTLRPESPLRLLRAATWGGLLEFLAASLTLLFRFKSYFALRAHQLAPQMTGTTEVFQTGVAVLVIFEYLLYPLSVLLFYLAIEGLIRFFAGFTTAEALPNFAVFLVFKAVQMAARAQEQRQSAALVPDLLEILPDGRVRIASARARDHWNASITISMNEQWFEVERMEPGSAPRSFVYFLRPASPGKVLRGYEEYDAASALAAGDAAGTPVQSPAPAKK